MTGTIDFIGKNEFGFPCVKITWDDGEQETRLYPSSIMASFETQKQVDDGTLIDKHGYFA